MTTLDKFEIDLAIRTERYYRDTFQWEKLRGLWHPDSSKTNIDISWFKGDVDGWIEGCRRLATSGTTSYHLLQPVEIDIKENRAFAVTLNRLIVRFMYEGVEYDIDSWVHQLQTFEKLQSAGDQEAQWKLRNFEAIYIQDSIALPYPQKTAEDTKPDVAKVLGARPSFRCLSWQMTSKGFPIRDDMPGYDKEETWKPVMERNHRWLELGDTKG